MNKKSLKEIMKVGKLGHKDVYAYLPYGLKVDIYRDNGIDIIATCCGQIDYRLRALDDTNGSTIYFEEVEDMKPILYPKTVMYSRIEHDGREIIPIVKCAEISLPLGDWVIDRENDCFCGQYGVFKFEDGSFSVGDISYVPKQYQLFDYLNELKIDYRGLIDAGLAIDVNTLNENPYK